MSLRTSLSCTGKLILLLHIATSYSRREPGEGETPGPGGAEGTRTWTWGIQEAPDHQSQRDRRETRGDRNEPEGPNSQQPAFSGPTYAPASESRRPRLKLRELPVKAKPITRTDYGINRLRHCTVLIPVAPKPQLGLIRHQHQSKTKATWPVILGEARGAYVPGVTVQLKCRWYVYVYGTGIMRVQGKRRYKWITKSGII